MDSVCFACKSPEKIKLGDGEGLTLISCQYMERIKVMYNKIGEKTVDGCVTPFLVQKDGCVLEPVLIQRKGNEAAPYFTECSEYKDV